MTTRTGPQVGSLTDQFILAELVGPPDQVDPRLLSDPRLPVFLDHVRDRLGMATRSRSGSRQPAPTSPRRSWPLERTQLSLMQPGPLEVVLGAYVSQRFYDDLVPDGAENGGWLFGFWDGRQAFIEDILLEGYDTNRSYTHIQMNVERALDFAASSGRQLLGDFHTHGSEGRNGPSTPSITDQRAWDSCRHIAGLGRFVGIIVRPRGGTPPGLWRWFDPVVRPWVTTYEAGGTRIQRATFVEGD